MKNERGKINVKSFRLLILPFCLLLFTSLNYAQTLAPGAPGKDAQWASAGKQAVGTSASLESKVWFTLARRRDDGSLLPGRDGGECSSFAICRRQSENEKGRNGNG